MTCMPKNLLTLLMKCALCAMCICAWVCGTASAETNTSQPYRVICPSGWEVSHLPSPKTNSGKYLGGGRVRVLFKVNGAAVATAIELTYFCAQRQGARESRGSV